MMGDKENVKQRLMDAFPYLQGSLNSIFNEDFKEVERLRAALKEAVLTPFLAVETVRYQNILIFSSLLLAVIAIVHPNTFESVHPNTFEALGTEIPITPLVIGWFILVVVLVGATLGLKSFLDYKRFLARTKEIKTLRELIANLADSIFARFWIEVHFSREVDKTVLQCLKARSAVSDQIYARINELEGVKDRSSPHRPLGLEMWERVTESKQTLEPNENEGDKEYKKVQSDARFGRIDIMLQTVSRRLIGSLKDERLFFLEEVRALFEKFDSDFYQSDSALDRQLDDKESPAKRNVQIDDYRRLLGEVDFIYNLGLGQWDQAHTELMETNLYENGMKRSTENVGNLIMATKEELEQFGSISSLYVWIEMVGPALFAMASIGLALWSVLWK